MALPVNIDDLVNHRKVESARIEYKASKILGIPLRDHIVIGTENSPWPAYASIRERMRAQPQQ